MIELLCTDYNKKATFIHFYLSNAVLDKGLTYIHNPKFIQLVSALRKQCEMASDWRQVRQWIAEYHGYDKYPGGCPMVTNHLVLLMALIMGGDDFNRSCMIACSAGWDTDCNAGNVGCLNAIRLGLDGFKQSTDLRKAVADRLYVVSADGGSCVSDAVLETRKILKAACRLEYEPVDFPEARMAFEYPGSVQGFVPYDRDVEEQVLSGIDNSYEETGEYGCRLFYSGLGPGVHASACIDTFIDLKPKGKEGTSYFDVLCSPALYSGQEVQAVVAAKNKENPDFFFFIEYFNEKDELEILYSDAYILKTGENLLTWEIPQTGGYAIFRLGICLRNNRNRLDGAITIKTLDWSNAPIYFRMGKANEMTPSVTPWTTSTAWLKTFVSSADRFFPDYKTTFAISHPVANGVVTTGTMDWDNYSVKSQITFSYQEQAGVVARAKGHRRYYGAVLTGTKAIIYRQCDEKRHIIAETGLEIQTDETYEMEFRLKEDQLTLCIDGKEIVKGVDDHYLCGGAGFVVDSGTILANGFEIRRM